VKYAFIQDQQRYHAVKTLCRVLTVSRSGYYDWLKRPVSKRVEANRYLLRQIQRVHGEHRGHSGALKTWRVLKRQGVDCGKHRVARLRQENDIIMNEYDLEDRRRR